MADKHETCWLCTQPEICKANGFCSIERCDLPTLVSDEKPSDAPGAWTCKVCGFRGFWRGGAHCPSGELAPAWPLKPCQDMGAPIVRTPGASA